MPGIYVLVFRSRGVFGILFDSDSILANVLRFNSCLLVKRVFNNTIFLSSNPREI